MHEDPSNGVLAYERVGEGVARLVVVVNCGTLLWQAGEYGVGVGGGGGERFEEVFSSLGREGGASGNAGAPLASTRNGALHIGLPPQTTLFFRQV